MNHGWISRWMYIYSSVQAMSESNKTKSLRIGFIHPDLGIGGAERLVVDAAVALKNRGHEVAIFTSRHDKSRCFEETRDGTLPVNVLGSSIPRSLHPKFPMTIVFSILRSILLSLLLAFSFILPGPASPMNPLHGLEHFDVYIVDQQSVCVPLLRLLTGTRVVFYCHFPDKLLSGGWVFGEDKVERTRGSLLKRLYRWPIDTLEEWTTGQSDVILSNSLFTSKIYAKAFPSLAKRQPKVVYPCVDVKSYQSTKGNKEGVNLIKSEQRTLLSLNRFEDKKNVALAIKAFSRLQTSSLLPADQFTKLRLVIGGGYDDSVPDNVQTLTQLKNLCAALALTYHTIESPSSDPPPAHTQVVFLLNFTTAQRSYLLTSPNTLALLYTPSNEHFGIVPLEAMACGLPVLAVNSGGPTETVVDLSKPGGTGLLRQSDEIEWSEAMKKLVTLSSDERRSISTVAKKRIQDHFSADTLGKEMEAACQEAIALGEGKLVRDEIGDKFMWAGLVLVGVAVAGFALLAVTVGV